ncbi:MAG: AAA family ATPase [Chloroflexi bacterium]|nr:AAA family ATPase [Chloroflexota bacterium]
MDPARTVDTRKFELPPEELRWFCDLAAFPFECTEEITPLREFIGQDRAVRSIEFGLSMKQAGYNIYVAGLTGTGKTSMVKAYIERVVKEKEEKEGPAHPDDWCYVYDFSDPDRACILRLAQGKGKVFREDLTDLLKSLKEELSKAFSSEEYVAARKKVVEEGQSQQRKIFEVLSSEVQAEGFLLQVTPVGPVLVPVLNGKPMEHPQFLALEEGKRKAIDAKRERLRKRVEEAFEKAHELEVEAGGKLEELDRKVGEMTVSRQFKGLSKKYQKHPEVCTFLKGLKTYTLDNLDLFKAGEAPAPAMPGVTPPQFGGRDPFLPFQVNVFVDNSETKGIPVVEETNPIYSNLFGRIERRFVLGGYLSDHTLLKAGSLGRANGGYLLLSARDVLMAPAVWPTLKRAIKNKEVTIEDPWWQLGFFVPQGLRPQPQPIDVKVVLIGDAMIYHLLAAYDEDFWEIFRVKSDFDYQINRDSENLANYASFVCGCCQENGLRHFERTGVARVLEEAARMVGDKDKLSTRFAQIRDIVQEADYWAGKDGAALVNGSHVQKAIEEKIYRHNLVDERLTELISQGTIMIDTDGEEVGQVNGLSVYMLGDVTFGKPSRITAKTFMGRSGITNIERESQMSGRIHDKGVLILSGYLGWKYAQDKPLSLSASLCFEQSYEGVEGDSASSTELYAILSSLSGLPVNQSIAVTGSVNQKGEIQPIGGVNQKIEGFFKVCQAKGLTGRQGVMIPYQNARNLMLRDYVIDAVREGKFRIYMVKSVDEGISVLTGVPAGERQSDGRYPEGTVNYLVDKRLRDIAQGLKEFAAAGEEKKDKKEEK